MWSHNNDPSTFVVSEVWLAHLFAIKSQLLSVSLLPQLDWKLTHRVRISPEGLPTKFPKASHNAWRQVVVSARLAIISRSVAPFCCPLPVNCCFRPFPCTVLDAVAQAPVNTWGNRGQGSSGDGVCWPKIPPNARDLSCVSVSPETDPLSTGLLVSRDIRSLLFYSERQTVWISLCMFVVHGRKGRTHKWMTWCDCVENTGLGDTVCSCAFKRGNRKIVVYTIFLRRKSGTFCLFKRGVWHIVCTYLQGVGT